MSVVPFRQRDAAPEPPRAVEPLDLVPTLDAIRHAAGALQGVPLGTVAERLAHRLERLPIDEPRFAMDPKAADDFRVTLMVLGAAAAFQSVLAGLGPRVMGADNAAV